MKNQLLAVKNKLYRHGLLGLLVLVGGLVGATPARALVYDDASNTWCGSDLQTSLNDADGYELLFVSKTEGNLLEKYKVSKDSTSGCGSSGYFHLVTADQWNASVTTKSGTTSTAKAVYKDVVMGSSASKYLPGSGTNAWTMQAVANQSAQVYSIVSSSGNTTATAVTADADAYPVISFDVNETYDNICIDTSTGSGTADSPYSLSLNCNTDPQITITNPSTNITAQKGGKVTLTGTVSDADTNQTLTVSATLGGVTKSTTTDTSGATLIANGGKAQTWKLEWDYDASGANKMTAGSYSNFNVTVVDSNNSSSQGSGTATYTGTIIVDYTVPTINTCTITGVSGGYYPKVAATNLFINGNNTGSFKVDLKIASIPSSGIASITFPGLAGVASETRTTGLTATSYNKTYSWTSSGATTGSGNVVVTFGNNQSTPCTLTVTNDIYGPGQTGTTADKKMTLGYTTKFVNTTSSTSQSVALGLDRGAVATTETGESGIASWSFERQIGQLSSDGTSCSSWGSFTPISTTAPAESVSAISITDTLADNYSSSTGSCYRYQVVMTDNVGNSYAITTSNFLKISEVIPAVTIDDTATSKATDGINVYYSASNHTVYYSASGSKATIKAKPTNITYLEKMSFQNLADNNYTDVTQNDSSVYAREYTLSGTSNYSNRQITATSQTSRTTTTPAAFNVVYDHAGPTVTIDCASALLGKTGYINEGSSSFSIDVGFNGTDTAGWKSGSGYVKMGTGTFQSNGKCATAPSGGYTTTLVNGDTEGSAKVTVDNLSSQCYFFEVTSTDMVGNTTTDTSCVVPVDITKPVCDGATWSPSPNPWKSQKMVSTGDITTATQAFSLSGATDAHSGIAASSFNCGTAAAATYGATCTATITDKAGNTNICTSPGNRVDDIAPGLTVTTGERGSETKWLTTRQHIDVSANDTNTRDDQSGLRRLAYTWVAASSETEAKAMLESTYPSPLDSTVDTKISGLCSLGTELAGSADIGSTQPEGRQVLFVCAVDNVGNVSEKRLDFYFSSLPSDVDIVDNVPAEMLTWNVHSVTTDGNVVVVGTIPAQSIAKSYELYLEIMNADGSSVMYTTPKQTVSVTAGQAQTFTITIPLSAFNPTTGNYTFKGPHYLYVTDKSSGESYKKAYNTTFYFPIYNTAHKVNYGAFIYASDSRLND